MIALLECMLELHKRTPVTPQEQVRIQREIDALVYGLYGLTDEEIHIVEGH